MVQSDRPTHETLYVYTNQLFRISVKPHISIIITPTALKILLICILLYAVIICTLYSIVLINVSNTSLIHLFFVSLLLM